MSNQTSEENRKKDNEEFQDEDDDIIEISTPEPEEITDENGIKIIEKWIDKFFRRYG